MEIVVNGTTIEGTPQEEKGYTEAVETVVHTESPLTYMESKCKRVTELHYPMFVLKAEGSLAKHQAEVLKGMITKEKKEEMMQYNVYIQVGEQKVEAGLLNEDMLKNLLISYVFRNFDKRVIFEDGEIISNDEIFALCPLVE